MSESLGHFLDDHHYDWSKPEAVELHEVVLNAYGSRPRAEFILARSGVRNTDIQFEQAPWAFWKQALEVAASAGRTRSLAQNARTDPAVAAYRAKLERLLGVSPRPSEAVAPVKEPILWTGDELITGTQETFLEMSFLHEGLRVAGSVVRLSTLTREEGAFHATGFVIAPDTVLTNHHVLHDPSGRPVKQVDIWFNYEMDGAGRTRDVERYEGNVSTIVGDPDHDWAVVRSRTPFKGGYPILDLQPSKPVARGDFVYIIQHPAGRTKKIGLLHNEVVAVTETHVQYLTDTLPGSSGAPVCNELWQVVALHHRGVQSDPGAGAPCKNQGIHVDRVREGLVARGILEARRKA